MKRFVAFAAATLCALGIAACGSNASYEKVCANKETHVRVDDKNCSGSNSVDNSALFLWIYLSGTVNAPAVGGTVTGGTSVAPPNEEEETVPSTGGSIDEEQPEEPGTSVNAPDEEESPSISVTEEE